MIKLSKGRAGRRFLKAMSLLVTLAMLLPLLPAPVLVLAGTGVGVESIALMAEEGGSLAPAADLEVGGAYTVQVTVKNGGAEEAAGLSVVLCVYGEGDVTGTALGGTQTVDSMAAGDTATLDYAWTPQEEGEYDLKAVVTAGGKELDTGDVTVTVAEVQETEEDKDIEEEDPPGNIEPADPSGQGTQTGGAADLIRTIALAEAEPSADIISFRVMEQKTNSLAETNTIIAGLTYTAQIAVRNNSYAISPDVGLFEVQESSDVPISSTTLSLTANQTRSCNISWTPSAEGSHTIKAVVSLDGGATVLAESAKTVTVLSSVEETVANHRFTVDSAGELCKVTNADGTKASGEVVIPASIGGIPVTKILLHRNVFYEHPDITKVTFPNTITAIEGGGGMTPVGAFQGCTNLEEVVFEDGGADQLVIGDLAFSSLKKLESVTLPTTRPTTIGNSMNGKTFYNCTALKEINLAESKVTTMYSYSFNGCTSLTEITLPATLTEMQNNYASGGSFMNCTNLESVTFAGGGTAPLNIGLQAFFGLTNLKTVTLPAGRPLTFGNRVFEGCTGLTSVNLGECDIAAIGSTAFKNTGLTDVTIMSRDAVISSNAFEGTTPLTLHGWYGSQAQSCASSPNVTFVPLDGAGDSVTDGVFVVTHDGELVDYLGHDTEVSIPASVNGQAVTKISSYALRAHTDITYLNIQAQITEIADYAFQGFNVLESITMPTTLKKLGNYAFSSCTALQRLTFGENSQLEEIGERAFYNTSSLLYIDLPGTLKTIGARAFYGAGLSYIELPDSITSIGDYAFAQSSLMEVELPAALAEASIGNSLFRDCTRLANVALPEGLTAIGSNWFTGCTALTQIDIPDTVTAIGGQAFANSGLTSLTIPAGVTSLPNALQNASRLESVVFLGNLTEIQGSAFSGCSALRSINIPATVTAVGASAFNNCTSLKEVVLPNGVTSLGVSAFSGCTSLEALIIPASVESVGTNLINNCDKNKLVVYVERGSAAASSANISSDFGTLRYPDFPVKLGVQGAAAPYQNDDFTVSRGAAASYGLVNQVKPYQVSVLDALALAHQEIYGWTPGALGGEMAVDTSGHITKVFGVETNNSGFTFNGSPLPMSYAASTALKDNDDLLFFTGKTAGGEDQGIAWFEFGGAECNTIIFALNRSYTLTLKTASGPVANIPVYALDGAGNPVGNPLGMTGNDGNVTLTFTDEPGTRLIAGVDMQGRYFFSRLTVTVYEPDLMLQSPAFAATPDFDTSSVLSNGQTAGDFVRADENGADIAAGFEPAHGRYNVYTNANITSLRFSSLSLHSLDNAQLKKLSVYLDGSSFPMQGAADLTPAADGAYTIPAFAFTGERMTLKLVVRFAENGQDFERIYDISIIRDTGDMAPYAGILDIQGANRTSLSGIFKRGNTSTSIYYDKGMTTATLDVKVQQGTEVYLRTADEENGALQQVFSGPVLENGRQVVTYRLTLTDFTKSYMITARRDADETSFTISSFREKSPYYGVFTPDRVVGYMQAPGQFVASTPGATLLASTAWSKFFSLGGFGGYVDYYYDEPITNDPHNPYGVDFIIYGNAFSAGGAGEAAGVQVSYDGVAWYDLAGQRHYELGTRYETATLLDGSTIESLLIARKGENGYTGSYPDKVSFGYVDVSACSENENAEGTYNVNARAGNPYRDINDRSNIVIGDGFDLSWAVDKNGRPVELPDGIRYMRVQNAVDAYNSSFGEVSTEIGTVTRVNPDTQMNVVGVTDAPAALTVNGVSISSLASQASLNSGQVTYYELNLGKMSDTAKVYVEGAEGDTIYVNAERYVGAADYTGLLDANGARTVRVIVQSGNKEPRVYVIRCLNGGDPAENADLASIVLTPGDIELARDAEGNYAATVENNVRYITFTVKALNPEATIKLDGEAITHDVATAALPVNVGANNFTLTITSADGSNTRTYPIVITRRAADSSTPTRNITVSFTFTGDVIHYIVNPIDRYQPGTNTGPHTVQTWITRTSVTVPEGSTVKYVTDMMLMNAGIDFRSVGGTYISHVQIPGTNPPEYLGEFDNGPNSGWMYRVNGFIADVGYAARVLENGDTILWFYTDDYTMETGYEGPWQPSGSSRLPADSSSATLTPKIAAENGVAAVKLDAASLKSAIEAAGKDSGASIVIAPEITGEARKVSVELPKASLSSIASETSADLTIQTPVGNVTIPNSVLAAVASQASGSTVTVSLEAVDKETALTAEQKAAVGDNPVYGISIMSGGGNISSFGGGSLTISLPYTLKEGEDPSGVTVWYLSDAGRLEQMAGAYDPETGLAAFTTDHLSYYVVGYAEYVEEAVWTNPFTDVKTTDWFYDNVAFAVQKGLFSGTSDTTFSPDASMTRAMLVTVLHRLEGEPSVTGPNSFTDVESGQWYTDAVVWATAHGIVAGYGGGLFGTNDKVTRQQLAAILYRYASQKGYDVTAAADLGAYSDAAEVSDWARSAMQWANAGGLIAGRTTTTLVPEGSATRAEVAAILQRFVEGFAE